jgi:hypothetical protein
MANKLAKLDDLKTALEIYDSTERDDELTSILEVCASITERVAGVVDGGLRRTVDRTFYPLPAGDRSKVVGLDRRPLESITSVKRLYVPSTPAEFDAATALVEDTDYYVASDELALIGLFDDWWTNCERANQVVATTGFYDPDDEAPSGGIEPPEDLQRANVIQAVQLFNLRKTAGLKGIEAGGASGQLGDVETHPALIAAAGRYRRVQL